MKYRILLIVMLSVALAGFAEPRMLHFGREHGLSNNYIMGIAQDAKGYVWVSTESGLNRFDGSSFRAFRKDSASLSANALNRLYADHYANTLWIATQRYGLDALDCDSYTFRHFRHNDADTASIVADAVTSVCDAGDERGLWVCTYTDGLDYMDKKNGTFTHYNTRTVDGWPDDRLWDVDADGLGNVYLAHADAGFSVFKPEEGTIRNYRHDASDPSSLPGDRVRVVYVDRGNNVWVGTDGGLALFNPIDGTFTSFRHSDYDKGSLISNNVLDITQSRDGRLWIATENGGVSSLEVQNTMMRSPGQIRFTNIAGETDARQRLSNKTVESVFQDSFGNVWFGTYGDGLDVLTSRDALFDRYDTSTRPFDTSYNSIMAICADGDSMWVGTDGKGVDLFGTSGKIANYRDFGDNAVLAIKKARDGAIWFGTYGGGVYRKPRGSSKIQKINIPGTGDVRCFADEADGSVLVGHGRGIARRRPDGRIEELVASDNSREELVRTLWVDSQGRIWVGSFGAGLAVYDSKMKLLERFTTWNGLLSNTVNYLLPDKDGKIWAATGEGLARFTPDLMTDTVIGGKEGLADSFIEALAADSEGNIWMSTMGGISVLYADGSVRNYKHDDKVGFGDFAAGSVAAGLDGSIYFGSHYGVVRFNPKSMDSGVVMPRPEITDISVFKGGSDGVAELFAPASLVKLPYRENTVRVAFNVLDASSASAVDYFYRVEGLGNDWYPSTDGNSVILGNLPSGTYKFAVKAVGRNGEPDSEPAVLTIKVGAPFWATWWAKLCYVLVAAALVLFLINIYKKRIKLEYDLTLERRNTRRQQELTAERMRFFTNITHELRTPLTLIIGPLEDLKCDPSMPARQGRKISLIHGAALRLLELINTILEFRKTETQNRSLKVQRADLSGMIRELGNRYSALNTNSNLIIDTDIEPGDYHIWFDPEVMSMIVDNLMSNACKYTSEGKVSLRLYHTEESGVPFTEISVSDTGLGMENETLDHIFDRYYRNHNAESCLGTGIGLALVYNLVKLHHGEIFVDSEPHRGSVFRFRIHSENCYPEASRREESALPVAELADTHDVAVEAEHEAKPSILVVEDNVDIINYISEVLSDRYTVVPAYNGAEGLEKARRLQPDMIISDIMMPEMDGIAMAKALKADEETSFIPLVVITAKTASEARVEAYEAGADSFISKPFSSTLLNSRIHNILDTRHRLAAKAVSGTAQAVPETAGTAGQGRRTGGLDSPIVSTMSEADAEFIEKVKSIITANMDSAELDVQYIAREMAMSHSTLYRKVKAVTGLAVNSLIRKCRAREAGRLLETGRYTVSEISYMVGISSPGNFRQCFKEEFGVNPSDYLKGKGRGQSV